MKTTALFIALFFAFALNAFGQNRCLTADEAKKVIESIKTPPQQQTRENKKLRKELLDMRDEREKLNEKISEDTDKNRQLIPDANLMGIRHLERVCRLIKENGWVTKEAALQDGFEAFVFLITNNRDIQAQEELMPVLLEAAKKDYIGKPLLASMVDSIRVGSKMPQIFGTQAAIRNNVVYLYPLLNEEKVDEWRKEYDMPPLASQIRNFEGRYVMPVLRSQRLPVAPNLRQKENEKDGGDTELLGLSDDENEAITVETRLVNLNVRVLTQDLKIPAGLNLTKDDFSVLENGAPQEITFFSNTEQPFDLVLLLDFSGSTVEKRDLIKSAALRFVELARADDRIAVVAFSTDTKIISELTGDKAALKKKITEIEITSSGSSIWDSVKFVYQNILNQKIAGRRSAMVMMTDADDNSPNLTFADAMEIVRGGDATVFPVYLSDTRGESKYNERFIRKCRQMLAMLAEETGGQSYRAQSVKDLGGIYAQVVSELGQIYSIGYEPKSETRDGTWRALDVKIKTRPELLTRTRRGYYAK
jgi:Ca-activated chloride channel family protein